MVRALSPSPASVIFVRCRRCSWPATRYGARGANQIQRLARQRGGIGPRPRTVYQVPSKIGISVTEALRCDDIKYRTGGP